MKEQIIQAINYIIMCLEKGQSKGAYTIKESSELLTAISTITKWIEKIPSEETKQGSK